MKLKLLLPAMICFCCSLLNAQWLNINKPGTDWVRCLAAYNGSIFAGTASGGQGGIFATANNGATWDTSLINQSVGDIKAFAGKLFAASYNGVQISADSGVTWQASTSGLPNNQIDVIAISNNYIFVTVSGLGLYRSADTGATWVAANNGISAISIGCMAVTDSFIFAGSYGNGVFRSGDNGNTWTAANTGLFTNYITAMYARGNTVFAGTQSSTVFISYNYGNSWTEVSIGLSGDGVRCFTSFGTNIYAGLYMGGAFVSCNDGLSWTLITDSFSGLATNVEALIIKDSFLFAGTDSGMVWMRKITGVYTPADTIAASKTICSGQSYLGFVQSGVYYAMLPASSNTACDSVEVLSLTVDTPGNIAVTDSNGVLLVSSSPAYQWYYNDTLLLGDTSRLLVPALSGNYFVVTSDGDGCADTSASYSYTATGLVNTLAATVKVYPVPATSQLNISLAGALFDYALYSTTGQLVMYKTGNTNYALVDCAQLSRGDYLLEIRSAGNAIRQKVTLE